jgi:hypothetical protein
MNNKLDRSPKKEFEMFFEDFFNYDFQQSQPKQDAGFETLFDESHLVEPEQHCFRGLQNQKSHAEQEADIKSLFDEPILPQAHMSAGPSTNQELPAVSNDPIRFYKNQNGSITYIFDPNTRRAYPLHPTVAPVTYPQGRDPPYIEIPADRVMEVLNSMQQPSPSLYITPSGLALPPLRAQAPRPLPKVVNALESGVAAMDTQVSEPMLVKVGTFPKEDTKTADCRGFAQPPAPITPAETAIEEATQEDFAQFPSPSRIRSRNRRTDFDASRVYPPLQNTPPAWNGFSYYPTGELTSALFSVAQIRRFLYDHPLNFDRSGIRDPKNGGLELFIQRTPSDSAKRYPLPTSNLCRFENCFVNGNTIRVGHYRFCFCENRTTGLRNPYHNAGYVHLFCLENFLDFPKLVRDLNVKPDTRKFFAEPWTKGPGPMELDRSLKTTAINFIKECHQVGTPPGYPSPADIAQGAHEGTLTHRLHIAKLEDENPVRARTRMQRGGVLTHDNHLGNLRLLQEERDSLRRRAPLPASKKLQPHKRKTSLQTEQPHTKKPRAQPRFPVESKLLPPDPKEAASQWLLKLQMYNLRQEEE